MRFNVEDIFPEGTARRTDLAKARILLAFFDDVAEDEAPLSRRLLSLRLNLRPATVSAMVTELIQDGLIVDAEKTVAVGKGRPEVPLELRADRIVTAVIDVVSRELRGVLVDMRGQIVTESTARLDVEPASTETLAEAFRTVADDLLERVPPNAEVLSIGIALPGIVDEKELTWVSAARWPRMANLDFRHLAGHTGLPVRIERKRQAELRTRFQTHPDERSGGVLLVNWGYGISSAYAHNGLVLASTMGGFGDLGHWRVGEDDQRKCLCGQTGCLEAHAALWALLPDLRAAYPDVSETPGAITRFLRTHDVSRVAGIERAVDLFALSLHNLFKAFFPDRIILTGYFVKNPWIADRVRDSFFSLMPGYFAGRLVLEFADSNPDGAVIGLTTPIFEEGLRPLLLARNARV